MFVCQIKKRTIVTCEHKLLFGGGGGPRRAVLGVREKPRFRSSDDDDADGENKNTPDKKVANEYYSTANVVYSHVSSPW